jgi:guanylate kinase
VENYDYILVNENGRVEECVDSLHRLIASEHSRIERNLNFVQEIQKEAAKLSC